MNYKTFSHIFLLFLVLAFVVPSIVSAHPGRTASDGKHYCRTNCASWGETYGTRHSHGGSSSSSFDFSSYTSPSTYTSPSYTPSYTPTYVSPIKDVYGGTRISGTLYCDYGYYEQYDSCHLLPANAYSSTLSGFKCKYGYEKVGNSCIEEEDDSYDFSSYYGSYISPASTYTGYSSLFTTSSEPSYKTSEYENIRQLKIYASVRSRISLNANLSCDTLYPIASQREERDMCVEYRELKKPESWTDITKASVAEPSIPPLISNPVFTETVPVTTSGGELKSLSEKIAEMMATLSAMQSQLNALR